MATNDHNSSHSRQIDAAIAEYLEALEQGTPLDREAFLAQHADIAGELRQFLEDDSALKREAPRPVTGRASTGDQSHDSASPIAVALSEPARTSDLASAVAPGTTIGTRYRLLEVIGEGGMGTVWMAEQREPMRRMVALKLIKPGMSSKAVLTRFGAERQALALMDHPNIAKVLDGGTTEDGRPYFVMELVRGIPLTQYCDERRLPVAARLDLFVQVCQAVQHAHQKGIIHRDIKPTNILVTEHDGRPVPKVIDFGLAKALQGPQALTEHTMFTAFGAMVGTPLYMAPEQVGINALDVDTRSDVYALGVILYELLTGSTPLEKQRFKQAAWDEICRLIREEEPPRPSLRLSSSDALPSIAACRHTEPDKLGKLVRGDLDWIVLKALEKDRNRRYETANGLAVDIQRHLADEPIAARPPTSLYRFQKMVRRNKLVFAAGSALAISLLIGTLVSTFFAVQSSRRADENLALAKKEASARAEEVAARVAEAAARTESDKQRKLAEGNAALAKQRQQEAEDNANTARRHLYLANMNLAQVAWEDNHMAELLELLKRTSPKPGEEDLRGFEWYYWNRQCHSELMTLKADGAAVAFSPDGKCLATMNNGAIKVLDAATGSVLMTLMGKGKFTFSPDGRQLASGSASSDHVIEIWDLATGQKALTLAGHTDRVQCIAFSHDSKRLASGSRDKTIKLWDLSTGTTMTTFEGSMFQQNVSFSPNDTFLVSGGSLLGGAGNCTLYDIAAATQENWQFDGSKGVSCIAFSPDCKRMAIGSRDGEITIMDCTTRQKIWTTVGHSDPHIPQSSDNNPYISDGWFYHSISCMAFSPDGRRLATGSNDQTIKLTDTDTGREISTLKGHEGFVFDLAFSPDGERLASGANDGTDKVWDLAADFGSMTIRGWVGSVAFSPDGKYVASGNQDDTSASLKLLNLAKRKQWTEFKQLTKPSLVLGNAFSPDGKSLAFGLNGNLVLWDRDSRQELDRFDAAIMNPRCIAFSPDGRLLAFRIINKPLDGGKFEGMVEIVDLNTGRKKSLGLKTREIYFMDFTRDGKYFASAGGRYFKMWDTTTWQEKTEVEAPRVNAISPDGKLLACNEDKEHPYGNIILRESASGREIMKLCGHDMLIRTMAFSPNGKRLASGSDDRSIKLWDVDTGQEALTLKGHQNWIMDLAFSPDGNRLASAGYDMSMKIWDARPLAEKNASLPATKSERSIPLRDDVDALPKPSTISKPTQK